MGGFREGGTTPPFSDRSGEATPSSLHVAVGLSNLPIHCTEMGCFVIKKVKLCGGF